MAVFLAIISGSLIPDDLLKLLLHIREVTGSNLGPETG
jgi:hypothetical protein